MKNYFGTIFEYLILISFTICSNSVLLAQTSTENYIHTYDVQQTGVQEANLNIGIELSKAIQTVLYYDGLGRPKQTVSKGITPDGKDLITAVEYNMVGLDETNYEPYEGNNNSGSYRSLYSDELTNFYESYFEGDGNGKSPVSYEISPLNRILIQGYPGADWQIGNNSHPKEYYYLTNSSSDLNLANVLQWTVSGNTCVKSSNPYPNNQLSAVRVVIRNSPGSLEMYEFRNKLGQVILKRSLLKNDIQLNTYYVYDDFGLLRFVITPEGSSQIPGSFDASSDLAKKYVYCYKYDERRRLIEKQVPGKSVEYFVYNKADKVILHQDGNLRNVNGTSSQSRWLFTKYDASGRIIMTGFWDVSSELTRDNIQSQANLNDKCWEYLDADNIYPLTNYNYYSNITFPVLNSNSNILLTINYYDGYYVYIKIGTNIQKNKIVNEAIYDFTNDALIPSITAANYATVSGMPTVSLTEYNGSLLPSKTYFDERNRVIQYRKKNNIGGYDIYTTDYSLNTLSNKVYHISHRQSENLSGIVHNHSELTTNTYDDAGRLKRVSYLFDNMILPQVTTYDYNALGKIISKGLGVSDHTYQKQDYVYNIRGWITKINEPSTVSDADRLFGMQLYYNTKNEEIGNEPLYDGNISAAIWQNTGALSSQSNPVGGLKAYNYSYDKMNRLISGNYLEQIQGVWQVNEKYSEYEVSYDLNSNILALKRNGLLLPNYQAGIIDNLTFFYNGNQLKAVDDAVTSGDNGGDFDDDGHISNGQTIEYTYDANGNLTTDVNKGIISINYNYLNLPISIDKPDDVRVTYLYDAMGVKKQQVYYESKKSTPRQTDFADNFVYENNTLSWVNYGDGRIIYKSASIYLIETFLKDYLGNVRVVYYINNGVMTTRQIDNYYPFGMNINMLSVDEINAESPNEYLYNSKMFQGEMGLNWLDYGARFYDAVLGRFFVADPLNEWHLSFTPYHYCFDNPINLFDLFGLDTTNANLPKPVDPKSKGLKILPINLEPVEVIGKKIHVPWYIRAIRFIARIFKPGEEEGTQEGGVPLVTSGDAPSPTKQVAEHPDDQLNIDNLLPVLGIQRSSIRFEPGKLTIPSAINKTGRVINTIDDLSSDDEIIEKSGGNNKEILIQVTYERAYLNNTTAGDENETRSGYNEGDTTFVTKTYYDPSTGTTRKVSLLYKKGK